MTRNLSGPGSHPISEKPTHKPAGKGREVWRPRDAEQVRKLDADSTAVDGRSVATPRQLP